MPAALHNFRTIRSLQTHRRQALAALVQPGTDRRPAYWRSIPKWSRVREDEFLSYAWQESTKNIIERSKLFDMLSSTLPETISSPTSMPAGKVSKNELLHDIANGIKRAPMAIRLTPHVFSIINWQAPLQDPIFRQFIPLGSRFEADHPELRLDSLHESADSPVQGLVHRYPDKVLFLVTAVCPVYCRYCTRSYAIGPPTDTCQKERPWKTPKSWEAVFTYLESQPQIHDVVVSGGDTFYVDPKGLRSIGERLLAIPHIRRFRYASKGLAVCPSRFLDDTDDWASTLIDLSRAGRALGKEIALHTHFNHPSEVTWVTRLAAQRLFSAGLVVRNQSVLLRGVNDDLHTMSTLIRELADINIQPMYVYQSDMIKGIEDMRTPLFTALELERRIRGTIAGSKMPAFIVDLPGGGGKRLACSYESYDRETGISSFTAPGVKADKTFYYYDPRRKDEVRHTDVDKHIS